MLHLGTGWWDRPTQRAIYIQRNCILQLWHLIALLYAYECLFNVHISVDLSMNSYDCLLLLCVCVRVCVCVPDGGEN